MFGEELARRPEISLSSNVAQGCGLLPFDSAGETVVVVSEVTGEEKFGGNGVEGMFNNDMTDDGRTFRRLATIHNIGATRVVMCEVRSEKNVRMRAYGEVICTPHRRV